VPAINAARATAFRNHVGTKSFFHKDLDRHPILENGYRKNKKE